MEPTTVGMPLLARTGERRAGVAGSRPRDRKELIRSTAGDLFLERGYHNVSLTDVADALGIAPSALYHHHRNKQELLLQAVLAAQAGVDDLLREAGSLDEALRSLAAMVVGGLTVLAVWEREARSLETSQRRLIRESEDEIVSHLAALLRADRPDLDDPDDDLVAWAVLGVLGSRARHRLSLPRRDLLLTEAIRLFDERGYQSVTMADIGEAAGIVASGVYRHFSSKTELLVAAAGRGGERLRASTTAALAAQSEPKQALASLVETYVAVSIEHRHLMAILTNGADQLPDSERRSLRRVQGDYVDIWVQALRADLPEEREPTELKIAVHAVHSLVYYVVRTVPHEAARGAQRPTDLGIAVLLAS